MSEPGLYLLFIELKGYWNGLLIKLGIKEQQPEIKVVALD